MEIDNNYNVLFVGHDAVKRIKIDHGHLLPLVRSNAYTLHIHEGGWVDNNDGSHPMMITHSLTTKNYNK